MNTIVYTMLVVVLSAFTSSATAASYPHLRVPTPKEVQEDHERFCRESQYGRRSSAESLETWEEYKKSCAERPEHLEKFEKVAQEHKRQCVSRPNMDRAPAAFLKCELIADQLRTKYLTLYELERQQLFKLKAAMMRELVKIGCPSRANAKDLRHAFARCHIHIMGVDRDGYNHWRDSLPKSVHQQVDIYKSSLKQQGLWTE